MLFKKIFSNSISNIKGIINLIGRKSYMYTYDFMMKNKVFQIFILNVNSLKLDRNIDDKSLEFM